MASSKGREMATKWQKAQRKELESWIRISKITQRPRGSVFESYEGLIDKVADFMDSAQRVLDVGSGPDSINRYVKGISMKVAVDPLISDYRKHYALERNLEYLCCVGEYLAFRENSFDLVFLVNVLDHVLNPIKALKDVLRVSRGYILIDVNLTPKMNKAVANLGLVPALFIYHPHQLSGDELIELFENLGFRVIDYELIRSNTRPTYLLRWLNTELCDKRGYKEIWQRTSLLNRFIHDFLLAIINNYLFFLSPPKFAVRGIYLLQADIKK